MKTSRTYIEAVIAGEAVLNDIDDYCARWHASNGSETRSLSEFLGMTHEEYGRWMKDGSDETLQSIIDAHRK